MPASVSIAKLNLLLDLVVVLVTCFGTVLLAWLKLNALIEPKPCLDTMQMDLFVHGTMMLKLLVLNFVA
ncbi:hypothetical protein PR202_gb15935 [Eleusine coracana subsp. coracana]|uniref:Uncharacterized protein n=1 Tax=Eleusine coracana subsp. coracana TaxID=191504 RepID=A0AAV5EWV8_ELECO|nr:hypothetical protein PR202_gb15935 [Eleusine coracana subsp. coracana]